MGQRQRPVSDRATAGDAELQRSQRKGEGRQPRWTTVDGRHAPGDDPQPRDIGWYDPWGDVVFYYGDVGYFNGIARIGRFTDTMAAITDQTGDFQATIELDA